jgi:hypothetical protein
MIALGDCDRWAFAEFRSAQDLEADFDERLQRCAMTSSAIPSAI